MDWTRWSKEEDGFRMDGRAEDNMFLVNEIIKKKEKDRGKLYWGYLDREIEKAYDRKDREMEGKVLGKIGLSAQIINMVCSMYVDTKAKYRLGV